MAGVSDSCRSELSQERPCVDYYKSNDVSPLKQFLSQEREQHFSFCIDYNEKIVCAEKQYLYSDNNFKYLDLQNYMHHVGHCHPKVSADAVNQMCLLNTNSRFLHDTMVMLAQRLSYTLPGNLECCFFTNSGSEANDLALQIAELTTGHNQVITIAGGYHGHLKSLRSISSLKEQQRPDYVHMVSLPDTYRGQYRDHAIAGQQYANEVEQVIEHCKKQGKKVSAFICEPILCHGGIVIPPQGYLQQVYNSVHNAGGLCIADELQTGFGRVGKHFWAFELHGVIPDIVTIGKSMGNGHPVAAVITTRTIANKFAASGIEYFNTFGGNPVSMAIASAVLDVIEEEKLQKNAQTVGVYLIEKLEVLKVHHDQIGDVRGEGLIVGIEIVVDKKTHKPNKSLALSIKKRLEEECHILILVDGMNGNVIKIHPPVCLTEENVDYFITSFDCVLKSKI